MHTFISVDLEKERAHFQRHEGERDDCLICTKVASERWKPVV